MDMRGRWVRFLLLTACLGLIAGCGDDEKPTAATDESSASSAPPRSTTTTSTTAPTTSSTASGCQGPPGVPKGATNTVDKQADADGDGTPDVIRSYLLGDTWHLVAELSSGGTTEDVSITGSEVEPGAVRVIGGTDLSGSDEREEIFVVQGAGASALIVVLYELEGCALTRVETPGGVDWGYPVGGGVLHRSLLSCGGFDEEPVNWLFEQDAQRKQDEDHWDVHTIGYALTGESPAKLAVTVEQDDVFTDAGMSNRPSFKCEDLSLE